MAKGRGKKGSSAPSRGLQGITLREENVGRKHVNPHSMLKLQHLQRLATWAAREASIPPLAAHFGRMLAASAELEGIPLDRSTISCQRCETILQPGNCTVRIEKNAIGKKRRRKPGVSQNNVVYRCNFCSHRNLKKGTSGGHMKDVLASRPRPVSESKLADSITMTISKSDNKDVTDANDPNGYSECVNGNPPLNVKSSPPARDSPKAPSARVSEKKRKIAECGSSNTAPNCATTSSGKENGMSSKRRRKGWSGLREITVSSEREKDRQMNSLAIPFLM